MKKNKSMLVVVMGMLVSSLTTYAADTVTSAGDGHARMRFFGQAVTRMQFNAGQSCFTNRGAVSVSKSGFGGAFGNKDNIVIGMPSTPNAVNLKQRDGILARAFYREYEVKAGEPVTVLSSYTETTGVMSYSCKQIASTFIPENQQDYEISLDLTQNGCQLTINKIVPSNGTIQLLPVAASSASKCTKQTRQAD